MNTEALDTPLDEILNRFYDTAFHETEEQGELNTSLYQAKQRLIAWRDSECLKSQKRGYNSGFQAGRRELRNRDNDGRLNICNNCKEEMS